jgi:hypothetical protein
MGKFDCTFGPGRHKNRLLYENFRYNITVFLDKLMLPVTKYRSDVHSFVPVITKLHVVMEI